MDGDIILGWGDWGVGEGQRVGKDAVGVEIGVKFKIRRKWPAHIVGIFSERCNETHVGNGLMNGGLGECD